MGNPTIEAVQDEQLEIIPELNSSILEAKNEKIAEISIEQLVKQSIEEILNEVLIDKTESHINKVQSNIKKNEETTHEIKN